MSLQLKNTGAPDLDKVLKIVQLLESPYRNESLNAARMLKVQLDKRGTGFSGLQVFKHFFRVQSEFERISALADELWQEIGFEFFRSTPQLTGSNDPLTARILKAFNVLLNSTDKEQTRNAASALWVTLPEINSWLSPVTILNIYTHYFRNDSERESTINLINRLWQEIGYIPKPERMVEPKTWRQDASTNPGDNYLWVNGYSYTRKGKTITVAGYWRLKPGAGKIKFKMAA